MRRLRAISIGCAIALGTSLLMARIHPFGNAGLYAAKGAQQIMTDSSIPGEVRAILVAKCADCHSMQTHAPFYGRLAPISWLMERDIVKARKYMNLSLWDTYSADQQQTFKAKIVQETKAHEMPPPQYRMIHWNTSVTNGDIGISSNGQSKHRPFNRALPGGRPSRATPTEEKRSSRNAAPDAIR